ncbi:siderophore ABC transporter substrate-binding protein [Pelistega europaea]|uniref:ABC transporter substrate-binding protein n=1 Tax=Pelistega europaea TaxID=106147 RepID=A0A7Y4LAN7_9BURK|nr:ABC transporter substrate-binding protein [Pelistega europaea]NOL50034.1 ABC transporter substrate-binding protein [Pelistega europaea]
MQFFKSLIFALGVISATSSYALEVNTARGAVKFDKPLTNQVAVYELSALDTLHALGVHPKGVPNKARVDYLEQVFKEGTNVGTLFEPDMEKLNGIQPEAIIIGGRMSPKYDELRKIAPVIDMTNPGVNVERAQTLLKEYGVLFGKEEKAAELSKNLATELEKTKEALKNKGNALMIMVNGQKVSSFGDKSRFGYLFNDFGLIPADKSESDARHGNPVSFEFIREMNPDWIIVLDRTSAVGGKGDSAKTVLENSLLKGIKAFQNKHVIYLDNSSYLASGGYHQMMVELKLLRDAFSK